jgi:hypothetical protein
LIFAHISEKYFKNIVSFIFISSCFCIDSKPEDIPAVATAIPVLGICFQFTQ